MANNETGTNAIIETHIVTEHEIRDHFNTCMKMYAENRISIRNAWNLKIIDYMSTILTSEGQSNEVLQVAATSIQAATKIYTIRVDDVHSNILKLASNLVRTNAQEDEGNVVQKQLDEGNSQQQRTHKRNKRGGKKATVSNDSSTLVAEIPRLPSTIFSNVQDVDMVATNLLSNKVPMHPTGYKFALLSQEPAWTSTGEKFTIHAKQYPIKIEPIDKLQLCPQFQDFEIDSWDEDGESVLDENPSVTSVIYNDEGVPVPEFDISIVESFPPDEQEVEKGRATIRNDYCCSSSKYVFGNKEIAQLWAGPNHLKFKSVSKSISGHTENKKQKSDVKRRTAQPINFLTDDIPPLNKIKLCKRKSKTSEEDYNKCTLPQKFILENSTNSGLMSKPLFIFKPNPDFLKEPHTNVGVQNVENNGVNPDGSFQDAAFENVSVHEEIVYSNAAAICEENLIDFPEMFKVHQDFKGYAAKEKRMNMKYLKRTIWKSLVVQKDAEEIVQKRKFSEVYSELPGQLNKKYKKELSCPQAFVALLHVANEKNLHFTKIDNENDFHIEKKDDFE